jgi:hypothetical protein
MQYINKIDSFVNPMYRQEMRLAAVTTALAIGGLFAPWETTRIMGLSVLTGVAYGIAHNVVASRECPEYFAFVNVAAKFDDYRRPLKTFKPIPNAVVWALHETWRISVIAGGFLALISHMPLRSFPIKVTAKQLAPCMLIGSIMIFFSAHLESKKEKQRVDDINIEFHRNYGLTSTGNWAACDQRNRDKL